MEIDELVEQIYLKLQEQFGIGEVCLAKFGTYRPANILWKQFIYVALSKDLKELYYLCGYKKADGFSAGLRNKYPQILKEKGRRPWIFYLLESILYKKCSECNNILPHSYYSIAKANIDGLNFLCKSCDNLKNSNRYTNNKNNIAITRKAYYFDNKADYIARSAKRRAAKLMATPKWADLAIIKEIYRTCPEGHHVDHIVPLQNSLVCGLHCEFNLQHLSAHENLSKGNKYEP